LILWHSKVRLEPEARRPRSWRIARRQVGAETEVRFQFLAAQTGSYIWSTARSFPKGRVKRAVLANSGTKNRARSGTPFVVETVARELAAFLFFLIKSPDAAR